MIIKARPGRKQLLHVGCGPKHPLPPFLTGDDWQEIRLDIDPKVKPDIVASITHMASVDNASVDGIYSSHNLEHLFSHEVPTALGEFRRVLRPRGFVFLSLPNLQYAADYVARGQLEEPIYTSDAGPISAIDVLFGLRSAIAMGNVYMAHKTGFTPASLAQKLRDSGFMDVEVEAQRINLYAVAYKGI